MLTRLLIAAALFAGTALPCAAQEPAPQDKPAPTETPSQSPAEPPAGRPIRNAPSPRALELAAYIYAASNVCGYRIGVPAFEALLAKQNVKLEDVGPRGPFNQRIQGVFTMMSNDMALHREQSCIAVAGEYGPEGKIAQGVLLPPGSGEAAPADSAPAAR